MAKEFPVTFPDDRSPLERAIIIRDALDAGVGRDELRCDLDALIAQLDVPARYVVGASADDVRTVDRPLCAGCSQPITWVSGPGSGYYRHATMLAYCPDKHPTPAGTEVAS